MTSNKTNFNKSLRRLRLRSSVYIENNGNVLLVFDPVYLGGCWILPGGNVEFDETTSQAAEREVFEETGTVVKVHSIWHLREIWEIERDFPNPNNSARRTLELIFIGKYVSGEIDISQNPSHKPDGIQRVKECRWFPIHALRPKINGVPIYPEILFREIQLKSFSGVSVDQFILDIVDMRE